MYLTSEEFEKIDKYIKEKHIDIRKAKDIEDVKLRDEVLFVLRHYTFFNMMHRTQPKVVVKMKCCCCKEGGYSENNLPKGWVELPSESKKWYCPECAKKIASDLDGLV